MHEVLKQECLLSLMFDRIRTKYGFTLIHVLANTVNLCMFYTRGFTLKDLINETQPKIWLIHNATNLGQPLASWSHIHSIIEKESSVLMFPDLPDRTGRHESSFWNQQVKPSQEVLHIRSNKQIVNAAGKGSLGKVLDMQPQCPSYFSNSVKKHQ